MRFVVPIVLQINKEPNDTCMTPNDTCMSTHFIKSIRPRVCVYGGQKANDITARGWSTHGPAT